MKGFAIWLYTTDKELFASLRMVLASRYLDANATIIGNINAWMPLFVFLAILLYLGKPKVAVYSLFFGLGTFILCFQASAILANFLLQPAPWKVEYWLHGFELPAFANGAEISLPDWPIAAMVGTFHFSRLRIKSWDNAGLLILWLPISLFCIVRIYAGYTYPIGALIALMIGLVIGWLVFQLARNVEILAPQMQDPSDSQENGDSFES